MEKEEETPLPELTLTVARYSTPGYNYRKTGMLHDLLLLELDDHVYLDIYTPACLPNFSQSHRWPRDGQMGTVKGWGATEKTNGSNVLMEVDLPIVTNKYCARKMRMNIDRGQLCAGGEEGRDSCQV